MDRLREIAEADGERPATRASRILRGAIAESSGRATPPLRRARSSLLTERAERPTWLEPFGGEPSWRRGMWGAIVALHGRYPRALGSLSDGWWADEALTELLCALAVWRAEIDEAGEHPREELSFHRELEQFARELRHQAAGVAKAWVPGAPPDAWS